MGGVDLVARGDLNAQTIEAPTIGPSSGASVYARVIAVCIYCCAIPRSFTTFAHLVRSAFM